GEDFLARSQLDVRGPRLLGLVERDRKRGFRPRRVFDLGPDLQSVGRAGRLQSYRQMDGRLESVGPLGRKFQGEPRQARVVRYRDFRLRDVTVLAAGTQLESLGLARRQGNFLIDLDLFRAFLAQGRGFAILKPINVRQGV